jgi:hypothetical protein
MPDDLPLFAPRPDGELDDDNDPARFLGQLLLLASRRGYAPGWIYHTFRARFGRGPTMRETRAAPALEPTAAMLRFVMAKHRRFASGSAEAPAAPPRPLKKRKRKPPPTPIDERLPPGLYARRGWRDRNYFDEFDIAGSA